MDFSQITPDDVRHGLDLRVCESYEEQRAMLSSVLAALCGPFLPTGMVWESLVDFHAHDVVGDENVDRVARVLLDDWEVTG